jgi:hypothetical protein
MRRGGAEVPRMDSRIPITYGEFYNFPRMIRFQFRGEWFFMRSEFDEEKDDYCDSYDVYLLPFRTEAEIEANPYYWTELTDDAYLGRIGISEVGLDESKRLSIDAQAFANWLAVRRP